MVAGKTIRGCIGFTGPISGGNFFQKAIMFFTRSRFSHSFICLNEDYVLEASNIVTTAPITEYRGNPNCTYELWRIDGATEEQIRAALDYCVKTYSGEIYGYGQILWFVYRWACEMVGTKPEYKNWFPQEIICSELCFDYEKQVPSTNGLLGLLPYDENGTHPQDLRTLCYNHPGSFTLIESQ